MWKEGPAARSLQTRSYLKEKRPIVELTIGPLCSAEAFHHDEPSTLSLLQDVSDETFIRPSHLPTKMFKSYSSYTRSGLLDVLITNTPRLLDSSLKFIR